MATSRWDGLLEAQRLLQRHFPEMVMVGGSAAILHAGHRLSVDADHVLADLRSRFPEMLKKLEQIAGWRTNRRQPPVLIPGSFQGVPTGLRSGKGGFPVLHRHLEDGFEDTPMAVEDVLEHGTVADWRGLAARVRADPRGETARSLRQVLANTYMYGTTWIWIEFWRNLTGEDLAVDEAAKKRWEECAKYGY